MKHATKSTRGALLLAASLLLGAGCAHVTPEQAANKATLDLELRTLAIHEAQAKRALGHRVWCVPFARTASGVDIRGNANTWWSQAEGIYGRTKQPHVGAVMAFAATRGMPMGHVAVVSRVISDREITIDHANWERNQVSLGMTVIDVSDRNDWSRVRVESNPGQLGKIYPINGFILPSTEV
ncbi:CHAP domain-containing protein [Pseudooceanicola onchidii]|uniref:CHAP domain-containing protein n=1 Tax=Pseudooceanicola onchidii TaxID=2562279 RepID=UPI0010A9A3EA|nr:CHAP domain-containing protein [Pseudooceanicola onchidii]